MLEGIPLKLNTYMTCKMEVKDLHQYLYFNQLLYENIHEQYFKFIAAMYLSETRSYSL